MFPLFCFIKIIVYNNKLNLIAYKLDLIASITLRFTINQFKAFISLCTQARLIILEALFNCFNCTQNYI